MLDDGAGGMAVIVRMRRDDEKTVRIGTDNIYNENL